MYDQLLETKPYIIQYPTVNFVFYPPVGLVQQNVYWYTKIGVNQKCRLWYNAMKQIFGQKQNIPQTPVV